MQFSRSCPSRRLWTASVAIAASIITIPFISSQAAAQDPNTLTEQENAVIRQFVLPSDTGNPPLFQPEGGLDGANLPEGQSEYLIEFARSPVVGNALRLQGVFGNSEFAFPVPRGWDINTARVVLRFQHSQILDPTRSNLTIRINGISIGSVALGDEALSNEAGAQSSGRPSSGDVADDSIAILGRSSGVTDVAFNVPTAILQDFNTVSLFAQQYGEAECVDPGNPGLWTEVLPDSHIAIRYTSEPVPLDFRRYPYPFFDRQTLDGSRIAYLQPNVVSDIWLTAISRFQVDIGRQADFRSLETRLVATVSETNSNEPLVIIGTPEEQPELATLELPFQLASNNWVDGTGNPIASDIGVLMLATARSSRVPVLVISGNSPQGVINAVQALTTPGSEELGTGQALLVNSLPPIPSPSPRDWSGYLPETDRFELNQLLYVDGEPIPDLTVRGGGELTFNFRGLPNDRFIRGNSIKLHYGYGPQLNPRTSAIEVLLDDVVVGGHRLTNLDGEQSVRSELVLPENLITPSTEMTVAFRLNPLESVSCGTQTTNQLWSTLYADSTVNLSRQESVELPALELLRYGFPFTAPQDLSSTAIVVPTAPSETELQTLLDVTLRLGRLSHSEDIKLEAFTASTLPTEVQNERHLITIGDLQRLPLAQQTIREGTFRLGEQLVRQARGNTLQTLPDSEGIAHTILSPWNDQRVVLALTGHQSQSLERIQELFSFDPWFFQLAGDTAFIQVFARTVDPFNGNTFDLEFIESGHQRRIENISTMAQLSRFLQDSWLFLVVGIVVLAIIFYLLAQLLLSRLSGNPVEEG